MEPGAEDKVWLQGPGDDAVASGLEDSGGMQAQGLGDNTVASGALKQSRELWRKTFAASKILVVYLHQNVSSNINPWQISKEIRK